MVGGGCRVGGRFFNGASSPRVSLARTSLRTRYCCPRLLGSTWSRMSPSRRPPAPLPAAVSLCNGPTACHGLCHRHGSGTTEARPPASSVPRALMGVWGFYRATWLIPGRIFGAEASPRVAPAEGRCAGAGSWTRGNLAARHAACAPVVEQSDKNGWQKLDEPQPGQVHPRLIGPAAVGARISSGEPTWRRWLLGCRRAPGPCRSRS